MDYVRDSVSDETMRQGEWYSVYQLSEHLGISRTPVRDALLRLEEVGLIEFVRNRGFRVTPTTPEDVAEIFSIRIALEVPAARRASSRGQNESAELIKARDRMAEAAANDDVETFFFHDRALHRAILTMGQAKRALEIVENLRWITQMLGASTADSDRDLQMILEEHDPIVEAILGGDANTAATAMGNHLAHTGQLLVHRAILRSGGDQNAQEVWESFAHNIRY